ncbi:MoaF C-terminal domain-containing protein [Sinomonas mesophila]|uniref:MoaF C-terminal domain-containing protein n=1 Tax=Sinomonas mesophila TaxID=1531955 RepID=UPI001C377767|nr:MoaF C-terminal domain-containing protein [Sinomonas mesophila]
MRPSTPNSRLTWTIRGAAGEQRGEASYEVFEMQPGLFFLHYLREEADHPVAVTMALDLTSGLATGAVGELGLEPNPHRARQQWFQGRLDGVAADGVTTDCAGARPLHEPTDELIGHRLRYAYSSDDVYDHVYLNRRLFTWLCVGGAEAGLGDTDACTYWKLREKTYLFSWLEKNVGVEGMVLIDLGAMRTVGIQFGLDQLTGDLVNLTMGAYAQHLGFAPGVDAARPVRETSRARDEEGSPASGP